MSNLWREEHKSSYLTKKKTTGVASILFCSILIIGYTEESKAAEVFKKNVTISSPSIVLDRHIIDGYLSFDENRDGISDIALSDIQIDLMQNEKVIDSTFTRNNGYFRFVNLPKGEFTLKISRVIIPGEDVNQIDWTKRTIFQKVVVDNSNIVRRYIILNKKSVVETPTTEIPTTEIPTTETPTTEAPTTETPTTEIPTTEASTTEMLTMEIDISGNTQSAEDKELRDVHTSRIEMQDDLRFLAKDNSEVVKDRNEHLIQDDKISMQDNNRRKLQKSISGYPVSREDDTSFPHIEKTQIEVVVSDKLSSGNLRGLTTFASNIGGLLLTR
ncbi:hypothetical protein [Macrococcoides caseolyticum]|uniref:hypothetical protein n=1 Tax=Macrococcoides caseolyticum TaxID=69966 RepID=UPI001B87A42B|nr:hypothetical protein [Macrococcus caseolyticus]